MPLSDIAVRNAEPRDEPHKLADAGGLYLLVDPTGSRLWYWKYRYGGKEKKLAIGPHPGRDPRQGVGRSGRRTGASDRGHRDPSTHKRDARREAALVAANTFAVLADEYLDKMRRKGKAKSTIGKVEWLLGLARGELGDRPMTEIRAPDVLVVLQRIEAKGNHETAVRLRATVGAVFRHAIATARVDTDPTRALHGAFVRP